MAARPLPGGGLEPEAELFSGLYQESHEFVLSFGGKDAYVVVIFIVQDFDDLLVVALSVFSLMVGAVSWPGVRAMNRAHQKVVLEGKCHIGIDVRLGHALCKGSLEDILNLILILELCHHCHFRLRMWQRNHLSGQVPTAFAHLMQKYLAQCLTC
jgi:hypothetical protein